MANSTHIERDPLYVVAPSTVTKKKIYDKFLDKKLFSVINELQGVLDKKKICSEVHMIFKKK